MAYGRRPYLHGRKFCQLLLGEFASFDWFLEALLFLVFFWTPYLLRGFLLKRSPFVSLLCGIAHPLGPRPFGLNFWGHPSGHPSGGSPIRFWLFSLFILFALFVRVFGFCAQCLWTSRELWLFMPMAWWRLSHPMLSPSCCQKSWTFPKSVTFNLFRGVAFV